MSKNNEDKIKYETIRDKAQTRENSTLVIATVASSASIVILTTSKCLGLHFFALVFALFGIFYRELTIFSIDRIEYAFLRDPKFRKFHPCIDVGFWDRVARLVRSFIFRVLLFLPVKLFVLIDYPEFLWVLLIGVAILFGLVVGEDLMISDC